MTFKCWVCGLDGSKEHPISEKSPDEPVENGWSAGRLCLFVLDGMINSVLVEWDLRKSS